MMHVVRIVRVACFSLSFFELGPLLMSKVFAQGRASQAVNTISELGVDTSLAGLEMLSEKSGLNRVGTVFKGAGGAFDIGNAYQQGIEKHQAWYQAGARGLSYWALADLGMQAGVELCVGSAGIACGLGAGMIIGSGIAMAGMYTYDTYMARYSDKQEDAKLDQADSSKPGDPCIRWGYWSAGAAGCGDGTYTSPQSQESLPPVGDVFMRGGQGPAWQSIK